MNDEPSTHVRPFSEERHVLMLTIEATSVNRDALVGDLRRAVVVAGNAIHGWTETI